MRLMFLEMEMGSPAPEVESLLSEPPPPPTSQRPSNNYVDPPNTLPLVLGGGIACGTVLFLGFMYFLIKASCRRVGDQHMTEAALREMNNRRPRRGDGGGSSPSSAPSDIKMKTPPRVPVVIIEPDASVEVAYQLENEPKSSSETFARFSGVPLWRTPTVSHSLSTELEDVELSSSPPSEKRSNDA